MNKVSLPNWWRCWQNFVETFLAQQPIRFHFPFSLNLNGTAGFDDVAACFLQSIARRLWHVNAPWRTRRLHSKVCVVFIFHSTAVAAAPTNEAVNRKSQMFEFHKGLNRALGWLVRWLLVWWRTNKRGRGRKTFGKSRNMLKIKSWSWSWGNP